MRFNSLILGAVCALALTTPAAAQSAQSGAPSRGAGRFPEK